MFLWRKIHGKHTIFFLCATLGYHEKEKISTYRLINTYNFNKGTLYHLKRGDNVNIYTLAVLCQILECKIEDVVEIIY